MFAATAGLVWTFARLSRFLFPDGRFLKLSSRVILTQNRGRMPTAVFFGLESAILDGVG